MKKTIIALVALAGVALADSPEWSAVQTDATHVTYTTTQTGSFDFDSLGDAALSNDESFSITMTFSCTTNPFVQGNAISLIAATAGANSDLYDISGADDQFRIYIRQTDTAFHFNVNNSWIYGYSYPEGKGDAVSDYSWTVPGTISEETPFFVGFTFTYVNSTDAADGDNYFTIAATPESQIQFTTHLDYNVVKTAPFEFGDLTNYTADYTNAPANLVTTISITKAGQLPIDPFPSVPEPTTATLSLLALAGLAGRRRRK